MPVLTSNLSDMLLEFKLQLWWGLLVACIGTANPSTKSCTRPLSLGFSVAALRGETAAAAAAPRKAAPFAPPVARPPLTAALPSPSRSVPSNSLPTCHSNTCRSPPRFATLMIHTKSSFFNRKPSFFYRKPSVFIIKSSFFNRKPSVFIIKSSFFNRKSSFFNRKSPLPCHLPVERSQRVGLNPTLFVISCRVLFCRIQTCHRSLISSDTVDRFCGYTGSWPAPAVLPRRGTVRDLPPDAVHRHRVHLLLRRAAVSRPCIPVTAEPLCVGRPEPLTCSFSIQNS